MFSLSLSRAGLATRSCTRSFHATRFVQAKERSSRPVGNRIPYDAFAVPDEEGRLIQWSKDAYLKSLEKLGKGWQAELVSMDPPIVRAFDSIARKEAARKVKLAARIEAERKEYRLRWGVGDGDLDHKLNKAKEQLQKGFKIDVVFWAKRRVEMVVPQDAALKMDAIRDKLADVGVEYQARMINTSSPSGAMATMYFRPKPAASES